MSFTLGGNIHGLAPTLLGGSDGPMEGGGLRSTDRMMLRRMLNHRVFPNNNPQIITPFRRYFNAGDTAGTKNSNPSLLLGQPINQVGGSSMVSRIHAKHGGTGTGEAFYSGNPKHVADGSDYVKFKKLMANNKNYNDSSFGGDTISNSASALRRVRR